MAVEMDAERFRKVEEVFLGALMLKPVSRREYLDRECGEDADLRHEVDSLLAQRTQAEDFLEPIEQSVTQTILSGRQFGSYRILSPLGAGGMGEVYRAHDGKLGRDVAIKTLPGEFAQDPGRLARFRREARTLASLNHPSIAAIYGLEESQNTTCLVLELVEGETLRGPLPIPTVLDYARQIAEGLEAAHEKGIVHRDLKPANVKVTPQGRVKILDFGLAKAVWGSSETVSLPQANASTGAETLAGHIVGSPPYMSPEQARGEGVDRRTDIWAFGCVLYELLTGKRAFRGDTLATTIRAILEHEPDWSALPPKTPPKVVQLLKRCLQKDLHLRLQEIHDAWRIMEKVQKGRNHWKLSAGAATIIAAISLGAAWWLRSPAPPGRDQWVQLTKLPDVVSDPALSPDGRMIAFIRSQTTSTEEGQIYIKILPDGEPHQLTNDRIDKSYPRFSPDGTRIAYTSGPDTWVVPVLGGQPQLWLLNASHLAWTGPNQIVFSSPRGIMTAESGGSRQRQVYQPAADRRAAVRTSISPDGKWVLLTELDKYLVWAPCRLVPMDGSSAGRAVGPAGGGCTSAAWSLDGQSMYFSSNAGGTYHIWRQRFPNGQPEQFTSGPEEERGIAMAPDGRSLITSVSIQNISLWLHDSKGERQISRLEGSASEAGFTPDGKRLCYLMYKSPPALDAEMVKMPAELWVADVQSGSSERVFPGMQVFNYSLSPDSHNVVIETGDPDGRHRLWLAPLDRSSLPRQIPNVEDSSQPAVGPDGDIFYLRSEGDSFFVYRVRPDGTGIRKAIDFPVAYIYRFTPNGRRLMVLARRPNGSGWAWQALALDGSAPILLGDDNVGGAWSRGANFVSFWLHSGRSYLVPISPGEDFPRIPVGGIQTEEQIASLPGARRIDADFVQPSTSRDIYVFSRGAAQRNLFRIPLR
jgi:serine/threonine protein kinase